MFSLRTLECPKRAFRLRLGRIILEKISVFFTTKNLQLVYPPFGRAHLMRIPILGQILDQIFDQVLDQGFRTRKYSVQFHWDRNKVTR